MSQSRINSTVLLLMFWNILLSVALIFVALGSAQNTIDIRTANTIHDMSHESQFTSLMEIAEAVGANSETITLLSDMQTDHNAWAVEAIAEIYQNHIIRLSAYHMGDQ